MTHTPTASLDSIGGAIGLVRSCWGDSGYSVGILTDYPSGGADYLVRHSDGSEFVIISNRYGEARQMDDAEACRLGYVGCLDQRIGRTCTHRAVSAVAS